MSEYKRGRWCSIDPTGMKFGRLTAISETTPAKSGRRQWVCRCDCGGTATVNISNLRSGNSRSCGCVQVEKLRKIATKHGMKKSKEYGVWCGIIRRCHNPHERFFHRYGGRGIEVCSRWRQSFVAFLNDMGYRPSAKHTIERKNNDGNYEPDNCLWATRLEQSHNKSNNRNLVLNGKTKCLAEWGELTGLGRSVIKARLASGWSVSDALTKPLRAKAQA